MRSGPAHDAHRQAVVEACAQAGVTIYRSRLGFRLIGRRLDIEVSDLIHIQPHEIQPHKADEFDKLIARAIGWK